MVRIALLVTVLTACSDKRADAPAGKEADSLTEVAKQLHSGTPAEVHASCEAARDKYLAWRAIQIERVADKAGDTHPELIAVGKRALEAARPSFVDVCTKLGLMIDASCFEVDIMQITDPVKKQRCKTTANELASTLPSESAGPAEVHDATCEAVRDKYLAWSAERVKAALGGGVAGTHTAELQAEADKELAMAKTKFVGACIAMGSSLDGTCFEIERGMSHDREKQRRCRKMVGELEAKMFAR